MNKISNTNTFELLSNLLSNFLSNFSDKREDYTNGFGFEMPESIHPIFLNMYAQNLGRDFGLFDIIQHLKYTYFSPNLDTGLTTNKKMCPIIFIPGLGVSKIKGKWDQSGSKSDTQSDCTQRDWTKIWFPEENGYFNNNCITDSVKVVYKNMNVINANGVSTVIDKFGSISFDPESYLADWLEAVRALGYTENQNLFGAAYDFRKICSKEELYNYCMSLKQLIEHSVKINGKKAILVGHSLGSNLANYFLVTMTSEWKDMYINSFASFSGAFGGCPKALRTILSGVDIRVGIINKSEKEILRNITRNFTGLQWMLPSPAIYNDIPLVHYNNVSYSANNIHQLLHMVGAVEAADIYKNVVYPVQMESLKAPGVKVYTFSGTNLMTESSYKYRDSLEDDPVKNHPYYKMNQSYTSNIDYPEEFNGDGTIPHFVLQHPLTWTNYQKEPIIYRFYDRAEHKDILVTEQPVNDFISILKQAA
jgi:hypothetical protein